ncbi:GNAT family N-acetyltransferase [Pelotomaculum propionicicum]|uniref:Acetoin utilization protein AcuA n=1 Tax=Pelotomaculum propionicicum TaxID=258475 RepID=A0A4Y7RUD4_9FIRM|nr:GNAT family N-acetyltransferase [Pelotomaculum propionicicum]NLI12018.1 GNAT family N-acetyltransferase [Peptococcaceae bacterium]TEB12598.1 Acetoin utilization protein AcuA [Pelotomaculum propionicicum]
MSSACCEIDIIETNRENIVVEGPVPAEDLQKLSMNEQLKNFRSPAEQKKALIEIAGLPEGMIYIARHYREIIGYVTFHYPEGYSRWSRHPNVIELGAIEISPRWRKRGIAERLLREAFSNSVMEDFIVITIEFCWHWDLERSGLSLFNYQKMLQKLFGATDLKRRATDDPDVTENPANVFMARIGKNVGADDIKTFESMLFEEVGIH